MLQISFSIPTLGDNTYTGESGEFPLPNPPLGVQYIILNNRNGFPHPLYSIIYIWRLFGARVDVNLNLIMHKKTVFSTQISKKSPPWEGDTPSHTLPLGVQYSLLNNTTTETVPLPPNHIPLVFGSRVDVNLNLITSVARGGRGAGGQFPPPQ